MAFQFTSAKHVSCHIRSFDQLRQCSRRLANAADAVAMVTQVISTAAAAAGHTLASTGGHIASHLSPAVPIAACIDLLSTDVHVTLAYIILTRLAGNT